MNSRTIVYKERSNSTSQSFTTFLFIIMFVILTVIIAKQICDLKDENYSLKQQLAFEGQKDAALKLAVRENIPENMFVKLKFSSAEVDLIEAETNEEKEINSGWSINLSVLWTSPSITPCDMTMLSQILVGEIYHNKQENKT